MGYRTFEEQLRHYLDRPQLGSPGGPVGGSLAWRASELEEESSWVIELRQHEIEAIDAALDQVGSSGIETSELSRADVDLGTFAATVQEWSRRLTCERGVLLVRGFPVRRWGSERTALATWCLGLHLGVPGAQNPMGDLLGHVRKVPGQDETQQVRLYQTDADIRFHCDYADVVGLMCLTEPISGGHSRIASSIAVHDEMWRSDPASAERLYQPVWLDARNEGTEPAVMVTPFTFDGQRVRIFYHSDYFRSADRHGGTYRPSHELVRALDHFDELAASQEFCVTMQLTAGDLQLLSNHSVVHARTNYVDDPDSPRHLLRLWLSTD